MTWTTAQPRWWQMLAMTGDRAGERGGEGGGERGGDWSGESRRRGRGRGFGPGFGPGGGHGFGHGFGPGGPPWLRGFSPFGGAPPRRERGDVRLAVLGLLAEEAMHGYQLIRAVARRSDGSWRISPGSVYPMLSLLEDEGLVVADDSGGRKSFGLTAAGRDEAQSRHAEFEALWDHTADPATQGWQDLAGLVAQVAAAAVQVGSEGTEAQRERAADVLEEARRALYRLLADDDEGRARP